MISRQGFNHALLHLSHNIGLHLISLGLILGLFAMLAASQALAQNCNVIGNTITCDDGRFGQRTGNFTNWSDGTSSQRVGNQIMCD